MAFPHQYVTSMTGGTFSHVVSNISRNFGYNCCLHFLQSLGDLESCLTIRSRWPVDIIIVVFPSRVSNSSSVFRFAGFVKISALCSEKINQRISTDYI